MKVQRRNSMFETNSSSSHSLVLADGGELLTQPFSDREVYEGVVRPEQYSFGWQIEEYSTPMEKLSYLYTAARTGNSPEADLIRQAIKEHTGLEVEFGDDNNGDIDHQSADMPSAIWEGGVESVKQFLFNPISKLFTDNDNH